MAGNPIARRRSDLPGDDEPTVLGRAVLQHLLEHEQLSIRRHCWLTKKKNTEIISPERKIPQISQSELVAREILSRNRNKGNQITYPGTRRAKGRKPESLFSTLSRHFTEGSWGTAMRPSRILNLYIVVPTALQNYQTALSFPDNIENQLDYDQHHHDVGWSSCYAGWA